MAEWTHNICRTCWVTKNPDREPVAIRPQYATEEICCFCGKLTSDGIFIRHNPANLSCTHKEE